MTEVEATNAAARRRYRSPILASKSGSFLEAEVGWEEFRPGLRDAGAGGDRTALEQPLVVPLRDGAKNGRHEHAIEKRPHDLLQSRVLPAPHGSLDGVDHALDTDPVQVPGLGEAVAFRVARGLRRVVGVVVLCLVLNHPQSRQAGADDPGEPV
ncbi:hypothetical protein QRX50_29900 [Amycolatopsis carbonis]|uniref:Uncharacterized protein n=1 Tax=Amycolatopsis carbonis TaxID=715471 RepID=A0A9Y2I8E2_9PSEU|nr:hypothetical protein [Amycolatopsis sp. 2-15]WIX75695.1 hypothetical protein QRX50_29900 [Amycolatopsis sp. 2-15]